MSAVSQALAQMIDCESGLGRLLPTACARRYLVANGLQPGKLPSLAKVCAGCPHGAKRAGSPALAPEPEAVSESPPAEREARRCAFCGSGYEVASRGVKRKYCERCSSQRRYLHVRRTVATQRGETPKPFPVFDMKRAEPMSDDELEAFGSVLEDRRCASCRASFTATTGRQIYCKRYECHRSRKLAAQKRHRDKVR